MLLCRRAGTSWSKTRANSSTSSSTSNSCSISSTWVCRVVAGESLARQLDYSNNHNSDNKYNNSNKCSSIIAIAGNAKLRVVLRAI